MLYVIYTPYLAMKNLLHVPELRTSSSYPASSGLMNLWLGFSSSCMKNREKKLKDGVPGPGLEKPRSGTDTRPKQPLDTRSRVRSGP